jgi:hypothetical protein
MLILTDLSTICPYFAPHFISFLFYEGIRGHLKNLERKHAQPTASVPLTGDRPINSIDFWSTMPAALPF